MTIHDIAELWIIGYVRAWNSSKPDDIARVFTEDAVCYPRPHLQPWWGLDLIVRAWAENGSGQSDWTFTWDVLGTGGRTSLGGSGKASADRPR